MDRKKIYEIFPFVEIVDVKFCMSPLDVELAWVASSRNSKNYSGEKIEIRDACVVIYDAESGKVAEIGLPSSYANLMLGGIQFFQPQPINTIAELRRLVPDGYEGDGFIVFPSLGVRLSGFRGNDFDLLTVTAFKAGWWDNDLTDMTRLA